MSCAIRGSDLPRPEGIAVNGVLIPRAEIAREVQHHPAQSAIAAWTAAARALAIRELLLQEAARLGIEAPPLDDGRGRREADEEALIRTLIEREVTTPLPDESTCRRYYEQNRRRFPEGAPFEAVAANIGAYLLARVRRRAVAQYVARLIGQAEIAGIDLRADAMRVH
jgi:peptidyl-prolyl cis-trans isomerase C